MNPHQSYPSTGEVIDEKYKIERILGEGGMGAVAKATHLIRRAPVALKFMSPNVVSVPGAVERFLNEGVAASQIESENVVHIFDVGKLPNGAPYLVMEYMEGRDLAEVIQRDGNPGIDVPRAIYFIVQALRGLQVAHDAGIIHRDMKPSNCFVVNKEGEADFVKLLDFGISKVGQGKSASLTQTNSALGTPLYMSPEQARSPRDVNLRSDLYSVGVILYELLTGRTPFNSESGEFTEILFKLFTQDPPPIRSIRADLSPELAEAVHRALARDPNDRYATAVDFALALEPFSDPRCARVLQRLRTHQPAGPREPSVPAPQSAEPLAAFSNLARGTVPTRTNDMAGAPGRVPADTQKMSQGAATTPLGQSPDYSTVSPGPGTGSRAVSAAEAIAATQYGGPEPMVSRPDPSVALAMDRGKQTDLGASRDTSVAVPAPTPKRPSTLVYVVPALLALLVGGGLVLRFTEKPAPAASESAPALTAEPIPTVNTSAAPLATVASPPSAVNLLQDAAAANTVASARANATSATTATTRKGAVAEPPSPARAHATDPKPPRLGDLKIHE